MNTDDKRNTAAESLAAVDAEIVRALEDLAAAQARADQLAKTQNLAGVLRDQWRKDRLLQEYQDAQRRVATLKADIMALQAKRTALAGA